MEFKRAGVVGGGIMGAGIIQVLLDKGLEVVFKELDQNLVDRTLKKIEKIFQSLKKQGKISDDEISNRMSLVRGVTTFETFQNMDMVIEAIPERLEIKKEVFEALDRKCDPNTILASNTSSLSISQLGARTQRPGKVIGMHWFNPAHIMKLVEIVPGLETSQETIDRMVRFSQHIKKIPIKVKECAGFLVNRLLGSYVNEALFLVGEGLAPGEIDRVAESLGIPMGPIKLGEMVGWDTIYHANMTLYEEYGSRFGIPSLLTKTYEKGRWGLKSRKGFYNYEGGRVVEKEKVSVTNQEKISSRLLSALVNEGIRCLDDAVASREDIDTAMKMGAGMPKGPLQWADEIRLDQLLDWLQGFKEKYGERFLPSPLLRRKVAAGHLGKENGMGFYQY